MTTLILLIIIFISLEIFESNWQKADTFYGVIKNNYQIYSKSIFLFFILNPTFLFALYLANTLNNFTFLMNALIIVKFADISFRLHLMRKIQNDEDISSLVPLDIPYNNMLRYINVILYPSMFILSLL